MVDEPVAPVAPVTAPAVEVLTPAPAPIVDTAAIQAAPVVVDPATSPAPPAPAVASPEPVQPVVTTPATLLAAEPVKAPETTVEAPKAQETPTPDGEVKNTEGDQSAEPAPSPTYDPFVLPEGITLEEGKVSEFTKILADLELGKADHALTQQTGQKLIDFHINEVKQTIERVNEFNQTTWTNTVNNWKDEFLKDPTYGGNRFQTTVDSALEFIRTHGGDENEQKELRAILDQSGLGNHKAVIRTFAKAMTAMKEGQPLSAQKPPTAPKSKVTTMYGN